MRANLFVLAMALPLAPAVAQQSGGPVAVAYSSSISSRDIVLEFQLADGSTARVALTGGRVMVDGRSVGNYRVGGAFERSFRDLLKQNGSNGAAQMLAAAKAWKPAGITPQVASIPLAIHQRLDPLRAAPSAPEPPMAALPPAVVLTPAPPAPPSDVAEVVAAQVAERLSREAARAAASGASVRFGEPAMSAWRMIADGIASLLGAFTALAALGFGFTYFAPRQLEVVADTTIKSFGRSFFTGLFAQPLVPVVFALLMLGLVLTIIGIITLPVAAAGAIALVATAGVGGYLAFARAAGELYLRRRMARGEYVGSTDPYRFLLYGVAALLSIWVPAVLFGWVPVAGPFFVFLAAITTWAAATVGFGAVVLSRGGVLGTFGRPAVLELTDEHLWSARTALPAGRSPRTYS